MNVFLQAFGHPNNPCLIQVYLLLATVQEMGLGCISVTAVSRILL